MKRIKLDEIGIVAKRLSQLGLQPHQIAKHVDALAHAKRPKPRKPTETDPRRQLFDGWCSGRAS
jgi:hypothetical protein